MLKLTPPQHALVKDLLKVGPTGIPLDRCHLMTVDGLMRRRIVTVHGGHVVLTVPTKLVRAGSGLRRVLDLPDEPTGGDAA